MKIALLSYHSNLGQYPKHWIDKYRESILTQTNTDFTIFELDYGGEMNKIFARAEHYFTKLPTFAHGMNYLLQCCLHWGYDYVFNSNVDDYYSLDRIEKQLKYCEQGYDIISSNFSLINKNDREILKHQFHNLNIKEELAKDHNIICHPSVCYSRKFIEENKYDPSEIPFEDMKLWQRTIDNYKFIILPDNLCYHRV